jgi:hypothetical protein
MEGLVDRVHAQRLRALVDPADVARHAHQPLVGAEHEHAHRLLHVARRGKLRHRRVRRAARGGGLDRRAPRVATVAPSDEPAVGVRLRRCAVLRSRRRDRGRVKPAPQQVDRAAPDLRAGLHHILLRAGLHLLLRHALGAARGADGDAAPGRLLRLRGDADAPGDADERIAQLAVEKHVSLGQPRVGRPPSRLAVDLVDAQHPRERHCEILSSLVHRVRARHGEGGLLLGLGRLLAQHGGEALRRLHGRSAVMRKRYSGNAAHTAGSWTRIE